MGRRSFDVYVIIEPLAQKLGSEFVIKEIRVKKLF